VPDADSREPSGGQRSLIPRLITQTWRTTALPAPAEAFAASWRTKNPDFTWRLFDDEACAALVAEVAPEYAADYRDFPFPVMRADFFRYAAVYRDGGVYADIDMECVRPIGKLLDIAPVVFSVEAHLTERRRAELGYTRPSQVANCIFAARPGHPLLRQAMDRAVELVRRRATTAKADIEDLTGPRMLTRLFFERARPDIALLPQIYLMPPRHYPDIWPLNRNVHARHHFFGSWKPAARRPLSRVWIERDLWPNPWPSKPTGKGGDV